MSNFTVYIHENKVNGKKYVGITGKPVEVRWGKDGKGYHRSRHFFNAINKYGWDNFENIIVANGLTSSEAKQMEIDLIKKLNTTNNKKGYNLTLGGQANIPNSVVRKRMSKSQKKLWNNPEYRIRMTKLRKELGSNEKFKKLVSQNSKNMWKNEYSRRKLIEALRKNGSSAEFKNKMRLVTTGENNGFYGKKHTEESKAKMRIRKLGKTLTEEHKRKVSKALKKPVVMLSKEDHFIKNYDSATDARKEVKAYHIGECCRGNRKTSGGYKWMYLEEYEKMKALQ